ncbi:cobalt ECF transporter T component CbiQ [Haloimpatiens sp. FM7315]|uniref:cobalt ECF transporter T component CbiQ n=1 Tax=Haloimpatiens sp. FM7315 TaxID=3298609 RepID=UPI0035A33354
MLLIDKYAYNNKLRKINPMAKFIFAIGLLILSLIFKDYIFEIIVFSFVSFIIVAFAKIPLKQYIKLLLIPMIFLIISIITILISISKDSNLFLYSVKISSTYFGVTKESIEITRLIFFRAMASVSATYFIALTIPMNELIIVFKAFRLPKVFIELMVLIYRFIFIFLEECKEIYNAEEMRFGYMGLRNSYKSLSLLIVCLFVRVMIKYEDLTISLESKLYDGEFKM